MMPRGNGGRTVASGNRSIVMLASSDLSFGRWDDARVQLTSTPSGHVFLSAMVGNEPGQRLNVRISPDEWERARKHLRNL